MNSKKNIYARSGLFAKAILFLSIGVITAMEAFGLGGFKAGSFTLMDVLAKQEFGNALLILWAVALFGYVFWRVYETIVDNEGYGTSIIGLGQRIGFCFGGLVYAFLAVSALQVVFNPDGSSYLTTTDFQKFIHTDFGRICVVGAALGMMGGALNEFYIAFSGIFKKTINIDAIRPKLQRAVMSFGTIGYASRGFTVSIAALLLLDSAYTTRDITSANKEAAFSFMQYAFGDLILGLIAIGFIVYSMYVFVEVRYRKIDM
ncbi:DUF1206 domain-containing protein [Leeuwenhoekiella sp. MAR_2009_132]|uniref:DUF1206 domain-containing protein n=1 Tax=Leeuwenhoekiella sp. MAR_2009_132 TaxID=1392489 RepID=UPI00048BB2CA|nr:DUF1206 domain-containing protein [Leeuwenhoekiella sp. MAR_2009_132]